jgi:N-acetylglucosaminylphosphatidylinositol deacetylase
MSRAPYILSLLLPILLALLWPPAHSPAAHFNFQHGTTPRVLLLTAHPDDEAFFFGPTLTALLDTQGAGVAAYAPQLHSLCLSVGDADGLGAVRAAELGRSLDVFGVGPQNRLVLDLECVCADRRGGAWC